VRRRIGRIDLDRGTEGVHGGRQFEERVGQQVRPAAADQLVELDGTRHGARCERLLVLRIKPDCRDEPIPGPRHRLDVGRLAGVLAKGLAQRRHVNVETAFFDE
jgi:hypothetical protein